ncbi:hypothetical protein [Umezawaea sp. Da 62-37]|uniref:hypothetical protein n=1 Tax=Umezawaea sp. Da 62-37 TaxID=3075927 RepID=UPI0028F70F19|nr:hypothetical protein [Umezawaea sp. Da 62-37]WNV88005.1 hypothetical protein RM788_06875 [Umezawaea sp. Da 62-37]
MDPTMLQKDDKAKLLLKQITDRLMEMHIRFREEPSLLLCTNLLDELNQLQNATHKIKKKYRLIAQGAISHLRRALLAWMDVKNTEDVEAHLHKDNPVAVEPVDDQARHQAHLDELQRSLKKSNRKLEAGRRQAEDEETLYGAVLARTKLSISQAERRIADLTTELNKSSSIEDFEENQRNTQLERERAIRRNETISEVGAALRGKLKTRINAVAAELKCGVDLVHEQIDAWVTSTGQTDVDLALDTLRVPPDPTTAKVLETMPTDPRKKDSDAPLPEVQAQHAGQIQGIGSGAARRVIELGRSDFKAEYYYTAHSRILHIAAAFLAAGLNCDALIVQLLSMAAADVQTSHSGSAGSLGNEQGQGSGDAGDHKNQIRHREW